MHIENLAHLQQLRLELRELWGRTIDAPALVREPPDRRAGAVAPYRRCDRKPEDVLDGEVVLFGYSAERSEVFSDVELG